MKGEGRSFKENTIARRAAATRGDPLTVARRAATTKGDPLIVARRAATS
jgi:hypothetical protein